jgi:hypothetical protein
VLAEAGDPAAASCAGARLRGAAAGTLWTLPGASTRLAFVRPVSDEERREWELEFEAAAARPLPMRLRYAFIRTYKPVLDDAPYRSFETTADYRAWCEKNLPTWLGYGREV